MPLTSLPESREEVTTFNLLVICTIFHPLDHGIDENSSPGIMGNYIFEKVISAYTFYRHTIDSLKEEKIGRVLQSPIHNTHPTIRNYKQLCQRQGKYGKHFLEIVKFETLVGNETVCYLQTFWLKILKI